MNNGLFACWILLVLRNDDPAFALAFWALRCDDLRTKAGRLSNAGWQGLTACSLSRLERASINEYLATLRRPDYALMHCLNFDDADQRIGGFRQNQICIWFRKEDAYNNCVKVLQSIPTRSVEWTVATVTVPLTKSLRLLNHRVVRGTEATLISVVATPETLEASRADV